MEAQDQVDVRTVNFREDEASSEGTQALRLLVLKLREAQANPLLQPMVQVLMMANPSAPSPTPKKLPSPERPSLHGSERLNRVSDWEEVSSDEAPRRRRVPRSPVRQSKRCRPSASPDSSFSKSGNDE